MPKIRITTKEDLKELQGEHITSPILLENNIDMEGERFTPIHTITSTFNGNGYAIKNMKILVRSGKESNVGLTGRNTGEIKNLSLVDSIIFCNQKCKKVGGLVGENKGVIKDCYIKSNVCGGSYVGGVAGLNERGRGITEKKKSGILKCTVEGEIEGNEFLGGIAGQSSSLISKCSMEKRVTGKQSVGGITGRNTGKIEQCSLRETSVEGKFRVGGIVGVTYEKIKDSWYNGNIIVKEKKDKNPPGGIAGVVKGADISNCYWIPSKDSSFETIGRIMNHEKEKRTIDIDKKDTVEEAKKLIIAEKI